MKKYPVNKGKDGNLEIRDSIQSKVTKLLDHVCEKHSKVLAVRYDVHYPSDHMVSGDNRDISRHSAKLVQLYKRQGLDPHYLWVREEGQRGENPHYHCMLFLNGHKVRKYNHVFNNAEKLWQSTLGVEQGGLIDHCTKGKRGDSHENGMLISKSDPNFENRFDAVHHQASYVSKESTKAPAKDGLRDIGMSRITSSAKK